MDKLRSVSNWPKKEKERKLIVKEMIKRIKKDDKNGSNEYVNV